VVHELQIFFQINLLYPRLQWEGYEGGEGEEYYGDEQYEENADYVNELNGDHPQNIPSEIDPNVSC
jgi:hypothetical protein